MVEQLCLRKEVLYGLFLGNGVSIRCNKDTSLGPWLHVHFAFLSVHTICRAWHRCSPSFLACLQNEAWMFAWQSKGACSSCVCSDYHVAHDIAAAAAVAVLHADATQKQHSCRSLHLRPQRLQHRQEMLLSLSPTDSRQLLTQLPMPCHLSSQLLPTLTSLLSKTLRLRPAPTQTSGTALHLLLLLPPMALHQRGQSVGCCRGLVW